MNKSLPLHLPFHNEEEEHQRPQELPRNGSNISKAGSLLLIGGLLGASIRMLVYYYPNGIFKNDTVKSHDYFELFTQLFGLTILFITLGNTSGDFLCPNLSHLSQVAQISEKVSGMTLLALGNSAPDLFGTYISFNNDLTTLSLGELLGSGFLCISVVIGLMGIIQPFEINDKSQFLYDLGFFAISVGLAIWFVNDGKLSLFECGAMIVCYISYLGYQIYIDVDKKNIIIDPLPKLLRNQSRDSLTSNQNTLEENEEIMPLLPNSSFIPKRPSITKTSSSVDVLPTYDSINDSNSILPTFSSNHHECDSRLMDEARLLSSDSKLLHLPRNVRLSYIDILALSPGKTTELETDYFSISHENQTFQKHAIPNSQSESIEEEEEEDDDDDELSITLTDLLFPFFHLFKYQTSDEENSRLTLLQKLLTNYMVLGNIIPCFLLTLTIPCYNNAEIVLLNSKSYNEVHKKLLVIQISLTPWLFNLGLNQLSWSFFDYLISSSLSILLLILTYILLLRKKSTNLSNSKKYRTLTSSLGFVNSIVWISLISSLVINILSNIGKEFSISPSLLGLTLFALGNSIGDMVSNVAFANLGSAMTGLGACFGSPLLYILLGIGVNGIIVILKNGLENLTFEISQSLKVSSVGLFGIIMFYMIMVPLRGWKVDRFIGSCAIGWWVCVTMYNVCCELLMD